MVPGYAGSGPRVRRPAGRTVLAGSEGLHFLPYLAGDRTLYPDPNARDAFGLRDSFALMKEAGLAEVEQVASPAEAPRARSGARSLQMCWARS